MADGSMKTLWVCSSNMGNQWVAVRDVYAWSNQDFTVSESFISAMLILPAGYLSSRSHKSWPSSLCNVKRSHNTNLH